MPSKATVSLTDAEYELIINTIRQGFKYDGKIFKPNNRIATILTLEANLGLRISDVLNLHLSDIIRDGERYRLDIKEQKTKKPRTFTVLIEIYSYIQAYALENKINPKAKLFDITERAVQKQLKIVTDYLKLDRISTHSFRKYYATRIYMNNNYNIELVRELLQHSTTAVTQRYIGISKQAIEEAIKNNLNLL